MARRLCQGQVVDEAGFAEALRGLSALAAERFGVAVAPARLPLPGYTNKNGFNLSRVEVPLARRPAQAKIDGFPYALSVPLAKGGTKGLEIRLEYGEP